MTHKPTTTDAPVRAACNRHGLVSTPWGKVVAKFDHAAIEAQIATMPIIDGKFGVGHLVCTREALADYVATEQADDYTSTSASCPFSGLSALVFTAGVLPSDCVPFLHDIGVQALGALTGRTMAQYAAAFVGGEMIERPAHWPLQ